MTGQSFLTVQTFLTPEVTVGQTRLLTESQAVVVRLPRWMLVWNRPLAVTVIHDGAGQRVQLRRPIPDGEVHMLETMNGSVSATGATQLAEHEAGKILDKVLAAAQPGVVFSAPVVSGQYTVITASEVFAGGGFGFGSGAGPAQQADEPKLDGMHGAMASGSGGGGGGGSHSRPVAAVVIGPEGVKVQPVVDATRVALAMMAALGGMTLLVMRAARRQRKHRHVGPQRKR